jgi:hypothetical protein
MTSGGLSGGTINYALAVADANGGAGTNLVLTINLPSGVSLVSASADRGSGCTGTTTLTCQLDFIGGGLVAHVNVTANVTATQAFTTSASVTEHEADPNQANNTASVTTTPPAPAARIPTIAITKAFKSAFVSRLNRSVVVSTSFTAADANRATVSLINIKTQKVQPLFAHSHVGTAISGITHTALGGAVGAGAVSVALLVPQDVFLHPGRYTLKLGVSSAAGLSTTVTLPVKKK